MERRHRGIKYNQNKGSSVDSRTSCVYNIRGDIIRQPKGIDAAVSNRELNCLVVGSISHKTTILIGITKVLTSVVWLTIEINDIDFYYH